MAFTAQEIEQFIAALRNDVALRDRVRDAILEDDFRALPGIVRQLGEKLDQLAAADLLLSQRIDSQAERIEDLARRLDQLAARVDDLAVRLEQLTARVDDLAVRLEQLTARVDDLAVRLEQLTARVDALTEQVDRLVRKVESMDGRLGNVQGTLFEQRYFDNLPARLGVFYQRVREMVIADEQKVIDARRNGTLSLQEYEALLSLDRAVRARTDDSAEDVIVAIEVSMQVDDHDVQRAHDRAVTLARVFNTRVDPVVAGRTITQSAAQLARELSVRVLDAREQSAA
jgi:DNA repair exonuclease SbcCD ATPase subunit